MLAIDAYSLTALLQIMRCRSLLMDILETAVHGHETARLGDIKASQIVYNQGYDTEEISGKEDNSIESSDSSLFVLLCYHFLGLEWTSHWHCEELGCGRLQGLKYRRCHVSLSAPSP